MLIVQKYGGSSVADNDKLLNVANRIKQTVEQGNNVVAVVSAQGKTTDSLISKSSSVNENASKRELDSLLSTGEQCSSALLSMVLDKLGIPAISLNGGQAGIYTTSDYGSAKIKSINPIRIFNELQQGKVVVVAGFQGIDDEGNITTLGRGGSDTTAVSLAAVLKADKCEIYSDVDGVYTTDPRIVEEAQKLDVISYDEMLEMASLGAKVLMNRAVEVAKKNDVVIVSKSSFSNNEGTYVKHIDEVGSRLVTGVAGDSDVAMITILNLDNNIDSTYKIFSLLAKEGISVDVIVQTINNINKVDMSFTVKGNDLKASMQVINDNLAGIGATGIKVSKNCAKVSVIGAGMVNNFGVASDFFEALAENQIPIYLVSTSEVKISAIVDREKLKLAMNSVHGKFALGGNVI